MKNEIAKLLTQKLKRRNTIKWDFGAELENGGIVSFDCIAGLCPKPPYIYKNPQTATFSVKHLIGLLEIFRANGCAVVNLTVEKEMPLEIEPADYDLGCVGVISPRIEEEEEE